MHTGLVVLTPEFDVYENMACDEVFCETMPENYILRFFNWKKNGITFGFSQKFENVLKNLSDEDKKLDITRRPTGGGIVIHKYDLTFSFIFYEPGMFNPYATYEKLHTAIKQEYEKNNIKLDILNEKTTSYDTNTSVINCFKKPVEKDLMIQNRKVLGGALRKFSDYLLYQASLQIENARDNGEIHKNIIKKAFSKLFNIEFDSFVTDKNYLDEINKKANEKYRNFRWIKRI